MKRVLIITYYWPPAGGSGVQRWLKYSKYLPDSDWQPVIYTPENPEMPAMDESLVAEIHTDTEVIRRPVWEPYSFYKWITGRKESVSVGFTRTDGDAPLSRREKLMRWIRGNFFIPDARRFWIRPSVSFLSRYLESNPVDAIISTGPPHSMHLIAASLSKQFSLPWIADFRDSWTGIDYYSELMLTKRADRKHQRLENHVLSSAHAVTTVSNYIGRELRSKGGRNVIVVPNGFDPADFESIEPIRDPEFFTLVHAGSLVPSRNPDALWSALEQLCLADQHFEKKLRIKLIGSTDSSVRKSLQRHGLMEKTQIVSYLSHADALSHVFGADVLLLLINRTEHAEGFLTGKVFEYLAAGKPVLCVGPEEGDAADLLRETGAGRTLGFDNSEEIASVLREWFDAHVAGNEIIHPHQERIQHYSRKKQAGQIAGLLSDLCKANS